MPKVVVYVPAADARWLEERHGDLALWVREQLKRQVAMERVAAEEPPPDSGVREPRRPKPDNDSGTAVLEPEPPVEEEAEAVALPIPDRDFKPDFKKEKKRR